MTNYTTILSKCETQPKKIKQNNLSLNKSVIQLNYTLKWVDVNLYHTHTVWAVEDFKPKTAQTRPLSTP